MPIDLILISFVIILGVFYSSRDTNRGRLHYIIICSAALLFVAAMRSPEWMTFTYRLDTLNYKGYFENTLNQSWQEIWKSLILRYYMSVGDFDIGFVLLQKVIGSFTDDFAVFSLIADLIFFIPFGYILYRYCTKTVQIIFAFIFYISLVQVFLIGGARQIFAIGFHMLALISAMDKKLIRCILFLLIGISMHFSSFIFVIPVVLTWIDLKPQTIKLLHLFAFIVFPLFFLIPNEMIAFMGDTIGVEKYSDYGSSEEQGGGGVFIALIELLSLFCLVAINIREMLRNKDMKQFYVMAPFFTVFAPLIRSNGVMIRMSLYFHLFLVMLVPYAIDCMFSPRNRGWMYTAAIASLALLAMEGGGMEYYFYWQV